MPVLHVAWIQSPSRWFHGFGLRLSGAKTPRFLGNPAPRGLSQVTQAGWGSDPELTSQSVALSRQLLLRHHRMRPGDSHAPLSFTTAVALTNGAAVETQNDLDRTPAKYTTGRPVRSPG